MAEKEYIERNGLLKWAREFYPEEKVFPWTIVNKVDRKNRKIK